MYQALYRKYRPKNFSDVYGQDHVTSTLKNEIRENKVSHAYIFTGSRGTGKTTCAKILAKAVNCEHSNNGEPCNECEVCRGLDSGAIYDVVEIDAASNNGVDNIRELREEANYTPSRGKYRVYIIDEVHMLSQGAFNALLKTLEEPPAHVIFILATTEIHKIPATILSRCQRFDFKRIQPETMSVRLKEVAKAEGITIDDDAAILIARIADGALRDGLSILDQCTGRSSHVDSALVSEVAGLAGRENLHRLTDCIQAGDGAGAVELLSQLYANSYDMERLCSEMIHHMRNVLMVKTVKMSRELVICTDDEYSAFQKTAEVFTLENIIYALDLFQTSFTKIKAGANARIEMEMAFIMLCRPKLNESMKSVLDRLSRLELAVQRGVSTAPAPKPMTALLDNEAVKAESALPKPTADEKPQISQKPEIQADEADGTINSDIPPAAPVPISENEPIRQEMSEPAPLTQETAPQQDVEFAHWAEFLDAIHKNDIALFGILNNARAFVRGDFFLIDSPNPTVKDFIKIPTHMKAIKKSLYEVTGIQYKLGIFKRKSDSAEKRDLLEDLVSRAQGSVKINFE